MSCTIDAISALMCTKSLYTPLSQKTEYVASIVTTLRVTDRQIIFMLASHILVPVQPSSTFSH